MTTIAPGDISLQLRPLDTRMRHLRGARRLGVLTIGVFVAVGLLTLPCSAVAIDPSLEETVTSAGHAEFPLWKTVPVKAFAVLKEGTLSGSRWGVYAYRAPKGGKTAGQNPCLVLARSTPEGQVGTAGGCGSPAPNGGSGALPVAPLIGGAHSTRPGAPAVGEAFSGMTFGTEVQKVRVVVEPGPPILLHTRLLSEDQSAKARLVQFRYAVFAVRRDICVKRIEAYDFGGARILRAPTEECPVFQP